VATLIRFYKPFRVLSQFTDSASRATLADFIDVAGVYPAGRLDFDSEGLLLLTDDGALQARIADPRFKFEKTYVVQVERTPTRVALDRLTAGVELRDGVSHAARAVLIEAPLLPPREPPIPARHRDTSAWVKIVLTTGKNRQVRRMLAAVGHPVLRLVRTEIGPWKLSSLQPGQWKAESVNLPRQRTD
jgi:23S rRNA pseudouridine2457 synthase